MSVLVTGAAGFIGFHVTTALLARGESVIGVDNLSDYYDVALKEARLARFEDEKGFTFRRLDIADKDAMAALVAEFPDIDRVIHLAAQAGVRYSLINPYAYIHANVEGQLVVMEACRALKNLTHLVYASSSSVYGGNTKLPFSVDDRVDNPVSLYAATKKSAELLAASYAHLYRLPMTGLRFFTVYGPWGRPDMAAFIFAGKIIAGEEISVFNNGDMERDFTYIDDIVAGILACLDTPPADQGTQGPHRIYNLGNHRAEPLMRFIELIEEALGQKAKLKMAPMQPGDVKATYADIESSRRDFGFEPTTSIDEGLPRFIAWYKDYHGV
ncbi:MAG: NAD-dependent epimerase/dehydratase family protein [Alphaproteobacteria bacterium]|nr:NAD-dependent epimerase/dehydratase family protein [Alphaproteobacteria bacterium]